MTNYYALPYFELQKAIFQKLIDCEVLVNITRKDNEDLGVYDAVDENTPYPYVTISEPYTSPFDTKTSNIETITFTMHAWWKDNDDYSGKRKVYEMLSACQMALMARNYVIPSARVLSVTRRESRVIDDNSPGVKHGILTIQYKVQNI
ncbi:DUF3168 domain-containing protein [Lysinibacillus xylanilyticus]|uniref:DUF3168 domain-containing protein n=1 Tax=Lysinibacillus xylanilyticus TaxID=582475 RepID=UPI002B24ED56|nr:DUF3168 domain-containing protein [Lysinibacillus xylanilyticus]MEB2279664.1 DUF3168 domain-containing protein [Lysinibacillus xylanilyticus]